MPFITEELWQRLRVAADPVSIALSSYPKAVAAGYAQADSEMAILQGVIASGRTLRAELVAGNVSQLEATLYARDGAYAVADREREAIERLTNVKLDLQHGAAPHLGGAVRSTPDFDLWLHLPAADLKTLRTRLEKEIEQLTKAAANSERQLSNEEFMKKAPEKVVTGIRTKLAEYQAQLAKSRATLEALGQ